MAHNKMNNDNETKYLVIKMRLVVYLLIFLGVATIVFFSYLFIISCFWLFYIVIANTEVPYTVPLVCSVIISIAHCVYFWTMSGKNKEN